MLKKQMRKLKHKRKHLVVVGKLHSEEFRKTTHVKKMLDRCASKANRRRQIERNEKCQATK